ncbi:MAG: SUMF1/EgtB/PvdO family nonheme iron enzyme [Candidatus Omnitrophota bacterium]|jgi:formylglycine-generating enzyme required for sulfatase activity
MRNKIFLLVAAALFLSASFAYANNVAVSGVTLENKDLGNGTVDIKFNLSQDNTYSGTDGNGAQFYDRIWVFAKYWVEGVNGETTGWSHATLISGGSIAPVSDGKGAFAQVGDNQTLRWSYGADGVSGSATVKVRLCAIEMAYIPAGAFVYNAGGIGGSTFNNYGGGSQVTVSSADNIPSGAASGWPNGYNAFYIAKYEASQGQYVDFLNMLSAAQASARYPNTSANRCSLTYTAGNPYGSRYAASSPNRSMNQTSWDDVRAYASWCALRPLTEMEFEKAARGGGAGTATYPWGNTAPSTSTYTFDGATFSQYYANYNNTSSGPINVGHYLSADIARSNAETGASIYGVTDLAGNNWEHLINCAWTTVPANGYGTVNIPASWPTAAAGKGIRGGGWGNVSSFLRVSDRDNAGYADADRVISLGVRLCRTSP